MRVGIRSLFAAATGCMLLLAGCQASLGAGAMVGGGASGDGSAEASGPHDPDREIAPGALGPLSCNHGHLKLPAGTYTGDLNVGGNHCEVEGAGIGQTIIEGNLSLLGNHNVVRGLTVTGTGKIGGNHCLAEHVQVKGAVKVGGNHGKIVP